VNLHRLLAAMALGLVAAAQLLAAPDVPVLRIGLFLPAQGEEGTEALAISRGARLAAGRLTAASRSLRIEITERPADGQWAAGSRELVALAYEQGATAVIGGPGGRRAHLAEQIVTRASGRVLFLSFASDPTVTEVKVPWVFRMLPDDRAQAKALAVAIRSASPEGRVALFTETGDYDADALSIELSKAGGLSVVRIPFADSPAGYAAATKEAEKTPAAVAVIAGRPGASGRLLKALDAAHWATRWLGPSRLACLEFVRAAGPSAARLRLLSPATSPASARPHDEAVRFENAYRAAYGEVPPPLAAVAVAAVEALAAAAARAGTSARAMAPALRGHSYPGLTGTVRFDAAGNRLGEPPWLGVESGRFVVLP